MQNANRIGRLDPKTGEIKLLTPPTAKSRPYGMAVNSKGTVFFVVQFGTNRSAASNPDTLEIREYRARSRSARGASPSPATTLVWYTDSSRGYLGRLDPATGKVTEWPSPSGPKSEPYGISAINDVIWYSESEPRRTRSCASIPRPRSSRAGRFPAAATSCATRSVTSDSNFVLANSLVNTVTLVKIPK